MGTRHLTCVVKDGEYKVAQYGQWDGYPSGQGITILNFLKMMDKSKFEEKLSKIRFGKEEELRQQWINCGANPDDQWVTMEISEKHSQCYPENSRDTGAEILSIIYETDKELILENNTEFATDSLFCEWAYVIDLDKNTFEVYKGFNKKPLDPSERFYKYKTKKEYKPVNLLVSFSLKDLPDKEEFLIDIHRGD